MDVLTEFNNADQQWTGEILFLSEPTGRSAMIARLREYWQEKSVAGKLPRRCDIDPLDLKEILPYLSIVEFSATPFRIKFRLIGSELARFYGREVAGKWLEEIEGWREEDITDTVAVYRRVHDSGIPVYGLSLCDWEDKLDHVFEFGCFPLSDDGCNLTHCLGIDDYTMIAPQGWRAL